MDIPLTDCESACRYGPHPFAVASLSHTNIKTSQAYDVEIELTLPHSTENVDRGNFMVGLLLLTGTEPPLGSESRIKYPKVSPHHKLPLHGVVDGSASPFIVAPLDIPTY